MTTMQDLNNVIHYECKRSIKNKCTPKIWHAISVVGLLFMILSMTTGTVRSDSLQQSAVNCSRPKSCMTCTTENPACSWSLVTQTCGRAEVQLPEKLIVRNSTDCPKFSLERKVAVPNFAGNIKVKISNDVVGFAKYLRTVKIRMTMHYDRSFDMTPCSIDEDDAETISSDYRMYLERSMENNFVEVAISFNNTWLRPDDRLTNMFMAVYPQQCINTVENGTVEDGCVTCAWEPYNPEEKRTHLMKWCSNKLSRCEAFMNEKPVKTIYQTFKTDVNDNLIQDTRNRRGTTVRLECADLRIQSISPSQGPRAGGTSMEISVKNHWIAAENANFTVAVAGRHCADPKWDKNRGEKITCTVSPLPQRPGGNVTDPAEGPVEVVYHVPKASPSLSLTSDQTFRFVDADPSGGQAQTGVKTS